MADIVTKISKNQAMVFQALYKCIKGSKGKVNNPRNFLLPPMDSDPDSLQVNFACRI